MKDKIQCHPAFNPITAPILAGLLTASSTSAKCLQWCHQWWISWLLILDIVVSAPGGRWWERRENTEREACFVEKIIKFEAARTATYGMDQHTETLTQHPILRWRHHTRTDREPRHWAQAPVETQPTQHRLSPSVRFALEASNIAKKPDWTLTVQYRSEVSPQATLLCVNTAM